MDNLRMITQEEGRIRKKINKVPKRINHKGISLLFTQLITSKEHRYR